MPADTSNQGEYLTSQWLATFRPTLSQNLRDRYQKGFLQVTIRPPIPLNFPILFPQQRGVFQRLSPLGGGGPPFGGPGPQPSDNIDSIASTTNTTGGGGTTSSGVTSSVGSSGGTTAPPSSTTGGGGTSGGLSSFPSGTVGPWTTGTTIGCGVCLGPPIIEEQLGQGCPHTNGGYPLCGSIANRACPGGSSNCLPTSCDIATGSCGTCPSFDWDCCYGPAPLPLQHLDYIGCCCNPEDLASPGEWDFTKNMNSGQMSLMAD